MGWGVKQTVMLVGVGISMSAWAALLYVLMRAKDDEKLKATIQTTRQTIIRLKVPKVVVGAIIGRNGCKIKEIQQKTNTRINFEDSAEDDENRIVIIRGSPPNAQDAENLINKAVVEQPEILREEIFVPSRACGRIIGKNGESIKYIMRTSKAKVAVDSNPEDRKADSLTRIVLCGTRQQIDMAIGMVDEKLAEEEVVRRQIELISANRPTRYKGRLLCIENSSEEHNLRTTTEVERMEESLVPTASDGYLEVYISAVENPSQFWVQLVGTKSIQLDRMVENMTSFYNEKENQEITKISELSVGDLVAASFPHDNLWYRARVVDIKEDDYCVSDSKITVFYIDFGDDGILSRNQLFTLQPEFLVVPFQAIECCLGNVQPYGDQWTEEAVIYFEQSTYAAQWKTIMAKPFRYVPKNNDKKAVVAFVELVDTNSSEDINIAEELIKKKYAIQAVYE